MKITKKQLKRIIREEYTRLKKRGLIKETLLLEEPADYYKDYKSGSITRAEYEQLVKDYENRSQSRSSSAASSRPTTSRPKSQAMIDLETEPIWKGSKKELEKKVHQYLIDIGFYEASRTGYVNPFSQGSHPDGGYTSNIPKVLRAGIASGDIDWATYPEMEPIYRKIDRSID
ncbi:MAG: hypothetical protein CBB97_07040 [Candidatus Endolissoclinum sp. TMED37]|nr:MAG: hypothetical protein CBB97_07040 [Candidatus Endolissoclinum sp. TMED37]|tara:strand:+ start:1557 stop:2075 length:519 start_codon:yes stop_codon:yes gene_type:complete